MEGNADFHPDAPGRAPDPSIEEMLRRARAARLGGDAGTSDADTPHLAPLPPTERRPVFGGWLSVCASLIIGAMLGVLIASVALRMSTPPSGMTGRLATPMQPSPTAPTPVPVVPTDTPLPPPTDTPSPTPTDVPTVTVKAGISSPPTTDAIVALAQNYFDNQSAVAGAYEMMDGPVIQIQGQGGAQLTVCVAYNYATVAIPDTTAGSDVRAFTLAADSDGVWQVVVMGGPASCSLQ